MTNEPKADVASPLGKLRNTLRARRTRRIAIGLAIFLTLFGLLGFLAAPPLIRHVAQQQLTEALDRPASIERVALDPYTLRLEARGIRLGERGGSGEFASIDRLVVRVSWISLLRFAPIVSEVTVDSPHVNVVRYDAQRFNFTDLVEKFAKPSRPETPPTLFSVSNIAVQNGRIDFDDRLLGMRHVVDRLSLGVPFIATLPSQTDIFVDPRFAARVDGSPFEIDGKTKPFAQSRESEVSLKFDGVDVPRMMSYVPAKLPVSVLSGKLAADLKLHFLLRNDAPTLTVTGTADLADAQIVDERRAPLFSARAVHVAAATLEPLASVYRFDEIRLDAPSAHLARDRAGVLSVVRTFAPASANVNSKANAATAEPAAAASMAPAASAAKPTGASSVEAGTNTPPPLDLSIKRFTLTDGTVGYEDQATARPVAVEVKPLSITLENVSTLARTPARYAIHAALAQGGALAVTGSFNLAGKTADAKLDADALPLPLVQPYLDDVTATRIVDGTLGTSLAVDAAWAKTPPEVHVGDSTITFKGLKIANGGNGGNGTSASTKAAPAFALAEGRVGIKRVDLAARTAEIARVDATGLAVNASRAKDGSIDLAALGHPPGRKAQPAAAAAPASGAQPAWHYSIGELDVKDAAANLVDNSPARPATLHFTSVQLNVHDISDDLARALPVKLAATLNGKGALAIEGNVAPSPLDATLTLSANRLDVAAFEPYFGSALNATVASALLNARADVKVGMPKGTVQASYRGGAALVDVRLLDRITSAPLAGWRALALARVNGRYDGHGTSLDVGRVTFTNFFGRVLLDAQGKLNLNDVLAQQKAAAEVAASNAGAAKPSGGSAVVAVEPSQGQGPSQPSPGTSTNTVKARIGEIVLQQGHVNYTDNFVKPNYSANLVDITGTIGTIATDATTPAPVDVSASLAGNGPIAIRGTVNPLAHKPSLDLNASAHDVELTNLSPYSTKYAGYPITKGKLNVELHYQLDNDLLSANNHIFIDQLTFGDHVQNDTATKLPVRLAISLLKNSRGQIDVNVPVSGSLSNPQFSLGGLIWSAIVHLVEKAVTAPFSLLANAIGAGGASGAEELHYLAFAPGSADLTDASRAKLDTLAKLLTEKPEVKLDLSGRVDPAVDTPALRLVYVDELVRQEKIKSLVGHGESVDPATVTVETGEYSGYLTKVYKNADFKKPRNLIGLTKGLPDDDMKRSLAAHAPIDEASLRTLAQQRAQGVRQYLADKVDTKRLFVVAPKLDTKDLKDDGPSTRVDFGLE